MVSSKRRLVLTLDRIPSLENQVNASLIFEFHEYLKKEQTSETWQNNNLKTLVHFCETMAVKLRHPDLTFYDINKPEQVTEFLDTKLKSLDAYDVDPDKKWKEYRTWND